MAIKGSCKSGESSFKSFFLFDINHHYHSPYFIIVENVWFYDHLRNVLKFWFAMCWECRLLIALQMHC